jgi:putative ATPase
MPLSQELRPKKIGDVVGQLHLTQQGSLFWHLLSSKYPTSLLLWGPPGCGKTTLARIYAEQFDFPFYELSATNAQISEIKKIIEKQKMSLFLQKLQSYF